MCVITQRKEAAPGYLKEGGGGRSEGKCRSLNYCDYSGNFKLKERYPIHLGEGHAWQFRFGAISSLSLRYLNLIKVNS